MAFWRKLFKVLPKKKIFIEGTASRQEQPAPEILEGELGPIKVTFDKDCEYEIVEREISPTKFNCPNCCSTVLAGMDFCNRCGTALNKETK